MQPDHGVGTMVIEQPARDHRLRAFDDLLRGLEDEQVLAAHIRDPIDERARDADHDRHVRIVAACVHPAIDPRLKVDPRFFVYRQRVDVGAQHHRLARPACVEQRHGAGFGRACFEVEA